VVIDEQIESAAIGVIVTQKIPVVKLLESSTTGFYYKEM